MNIEGNKHLTLCDRKKNQELLNDNAKCKFIAELLGKDERTISKKTKNRRNGEENKRYGLYGKFDNDECKRLLRFPFVCNGCSKRKRVSKK